MKGLIMWFKNFSVMKGLGSFFSWFPETQTPSLWVHLYTTQWTQPFTTHKAFCPFVGDKKENGIGSFRFNSISMETLFFLFVGNTHQ